jgi:hypothetical protein
MAMKRRVISLLLIVSLSGGTLLGGGCIGGGLGNFIMNGFGNPIANSVLELAAGFFLTTFVTPLIKGDTDQDQDVA